MRRANSIATRQAPNLAEFARLDHRMHNKSMIVDGAVALVGGRNVADEYYGLHQTANFRDLELLVGGPAVRILSETFASYWNNRCSIPVGQLAHVRPMSPDPAQLAAGSVEIAALHTELTESARLDAWRALRRRAIEGEVTLLVDALPRDNPATAADAPVQVADALIQLFNEVDQVFIGSANLDPRSLRINTEMGLLVRSTTLNRELHAALQPDFGAGNAWNLRIDERGRTQWISGQTVLTAQPASSFMQRVEDWFFAHLPIEAEM